MAQLSVSLENSSPPLKHLLCRTHLTMSPTSKRTCRRSDLLHPRPTQRNSNVIDGLSTATHVFIRHEAVRKPLQAPYDGPYPVIKRTDKHFTVNINDRHDTVSIDRLKPAHLDTDNSLLTSHPADYNLNHPTMSDHPLWSTCPLPSVPLHTRVIRHWGGVV